MSDAEDGLRDLTADELTAVSDVVRALVGNDVRLLQSIGAYDNDSDPYLWTRDYGRWGHVDLAVPPGETDQWEGSVIRSDSTPNWAAVIVDMWTDQEGRSDLSLELELTTNADSSVSIRFRDLHVM